MIPPATPRNPNRNIAPATPSRAGRVFGCDPFITHPTLVGDRKYLRALRAAEMAAWDAGLAWDARTIAAKTESRLQ
jgi:hypothetical protein